MRSWLNRTVVGVSVTSFLADVGYEMATALLPGFVYAINLPAAPAVVGMIDGPADLFSSFAKLGSGWFGDRIGRRKPIVVAGYALTGLAYGLWSFAVGWPLLLLGKVIAWFGKGIRGPLRNAILAEAVPGEHRGKAFGLHRAADTLGAIVGPLIGAALIQLLAPHYPDDAGVPYRWAFALTLVPGLLAVIAFAILVREQRRPPGEMRPAFRAALRDLPIPFRRYLVGVGIFGLGDFSRSLLILATIAILTPSMGAKDSATYAAILYAWHNAIHAAAAFAAGWLSDRIGRRGLLIAGYFLGALVTFALTAMFASGTNSLGLLVAMICGSGIYVGIEETLENAITADLAPDLSIRGTAFGVLGVVNGVGDFIASAVVGGLWLIAPQYGFFFATMMMLIGAFVLWRTK
jgi:MFS family permease